MEIIRKSVITILVILSSVIFLQAQNVVITSVSSTPVTCGGGSDGTITVTVTGGIGLYTYQLVQEGFFVEDSGPIPPQNYTFTGHDKYSGYIVIVRDQDAGTGHGFTFADIGGPEPITITSYLATDITCNGVNDGTITVTAIGDGGNYIYDLNGPVIQSNENGFFSGLPQGDYTVTVSDKDGCPSTDVTPVLTINNPSPVSIAVDNITDVLCYGDLTGSITITPSGGTPGGVGTGYTYAWSGPGSFSSSAEDIINLEAGDYFVTAFDGNMCSGNAGPITINQSPEITVTLNNSTDVSCYGGNDGTAEITAGGGAGGYSFSWEGQSYGAISTDEDPVNLVADTYNLIVVDGDACSKTFISIVTIDEPAPFAILVDGTTNVSCFGGSDGDANVTPSGGTPPYTLFWTGAISGYSFSGEDPVNMPADDYSVTITDSRGCNQLFNSLLTITEPPLLTMVLDGFAPVSCYAGNDGSANITISGGTAPYNTSWTGDGTGYLSSSEDPTDLIADTYDLIITDNNGCILNANDLVTILQPTQLMVTVDDITHVNCNGEATGEIEISPTGGTPGYNYLWSGPNGFSASTRDISSLEAGDYSLTITDANGCSRDFIDVATVLENTLISASFNLTDITCNGGSDGAIEATVSGGTPNYIYDWTGPFGFTASTEDISGLIAGDYQLSVTDDLGCLQVMPVQTLIEPSAISVTESHVNIACFGDGDGSIDLTPSGGVPPYTFNWSGPGSFASSTEDISGLEAGNYSVTITDANLCSTPFTNIVTILEQPELQVTPLKTDISCNGLTDGAIDITVSGGTPSYSFDWTGPSGFNSALEDISGLGPGDYNLTITDGNMCIVSFPVIETILEPSPIVASYVSHQNVLCNGGASGSIQINVTGGTIPLTFDWANSFGITQSTDEDPIGLPAETYTLTINDINGCVVTYPDFVDITEPPPLSSTLTGTNIDCFGAGNGAISVASTGGSGAYEYSNVSDLGPYQPGNLYTPLGPGLHTIWTRDANLCVVSDTITILESEEIQILGETPGGSILCYGDSSAQISIDGISGGVAPYEYSINNGVDFYTTSLFTNLPAGNYQTVVRDASACIVFGDLNVIIQPPLLQIDSYSTIDITTCFDALEGQIDISGTGGTGILSYTLNGTLQNLSGNFPNLPGGPHQVSIEDQNSCLLDTTMVILAPPEILVDNLTVVDVAGCNGDLNGTVSVAGSGGTGTITYSINGVDFFVSGSFNGLGAGNYTLTLKDDNDCTRDSIISIAEPASLSISSATVDSITCSGANNGTIDITSTGGTAPIKYTLNPGAISNDHGLFTGLAPGIYTVEVDDAEGCGPLNTAPLTITEPPLLVIDSIIDVNIPCYGTDDGSISIFASGGTPPYEYTVDDQGSWFPNSLFTGLTPGSYEVYVRDSNLCLVYGGSFLMVDPPQLSVSVTATDIADCAGDTTGVIEAIGSGGVGNLVYSLDGSVFQSSGTFSDLSASSYTTYVRDESGCEVTEPVTINEPDPLMATITKTDATYGNLGSITISGSTGGTPPYEYSIEGDTGTFSGDTVYTDLEAAMYHVIMRDLIGCSYEEMVNILDAPPLDVVVNITQISCFGADDGSIEFIPQDAEGAVEYSIDSGMNFVSSALFENLPGNTTYYLVARDTAGKIFTAVETLVEPTEILLSRNLTPANCNAFSPTGSINITVSGGSGTYSYLWSDGSTDEDRSSIVAGTYILVTTDTDNCSRTDSIEVNSLVIVTAFAGQDTTICYGETIQLNGLGGHIPSWDQSAFITDTSIANPLTLAITQSTTFVLTITEETSAFGCYNIDSIDIILFPQTGINATENTLIISGTSVPLEATGGPFSEYRWEPSTGLDNGTIPNPLATPVESITYYVYGTNTYGCEEMDSVFIEVIEDLQVYNVFSPNGDGINDFFEIENSERFPDILVEVYSRWGDQLFSTVGYSDGSRWDGTARGKDAPVGTYYYVIIPYSGAEPITGNVTIIR